MVALGGGSPTVVALGGSDGVLGGCCGVCGCGIWGLRGVVCGASGGMEVIYK